MACGFCGGKISPIRVDRTINTKPRQVNGILVKKLSSKGKSENEKSIVTSNDLDKHRA